MSELTKQALKVDNNMSFPNNNAGLITPTALRGFNENMIDSTVNQAVYTADSASFNQRINAATASLATVPWDNVTSKPTNLVSASSDTTNVDFTITNGTISANLIGGVVSGSGQISGLGFVSSSITGSSIVTASFASQNLTFTKGDGSQFSLFIPDNSGSVLPSGVISGSSQITALGFVSSSVTGSSVITASFSGNTLTFTKGNGTTFGVVIPDVSGSVIDTGSFITNIQNNPLTPLTLTYSKAAGDTNVTLDLPSNVVSGSSQVSYTGLSNIPSGIVSGAAQVTPLLPSGVVSGSSQLTASYDQRYALSGSGGGTINTGSFATTGSNTFIGNQTITGSLAISSSTSCSVIVPNGFNDEGFLINGNLRVTNGNLRVDQSIITAGIYTQTLARNSNDPINVDNGLNIRPNAPGLSATNVSISGSLILSQSIQVGGDLTASLQQGYVWVGDSSGKTTTVPTSSFGGGGSLPSGLLSSSVTNFTDYSASVDTRINNIVAGTGFATTGSNTFTGNQNIQGTLTASIQEGFVLVGGAGNVSTLAATSSFGGGGGSTFPFTGDAVITGSLTISSSLPIDLDVVGGARITGSLLLTGSSIFTGDQTFVDGAGNTITLSDASGSLMFVAKGFTSASAHFTGSAGNQVNLIFKNNDNTTSTIISGSNNIFTNPSAPTAEFRRIIGNNNIVNSATGIPQVTGSMTTPITMASNYFGSGTTSVRGPVTGSLFTISNNSIIGTLNLGQPAVNDLTRVSAFTFTGNQVIGTMTFGASTSATLPNIATTPSITNNIVNGAMQATMNSSSLAVSNNIVNAGSFIIANNHFTTAAGSGQTTINGNLVGGVQFTNLTVQGVNPAGTTNNPAFNGNLSYGISNAAHINADLARTSGTNAYTALNATAILGANLAVTGSSLGSDTTSFGSAFVGRFNANDGIRNKTSDIVFAVGTGTATGTRKTGLLVDSGSNTFVEGTLNVSGSTSFTGSVTIQSNSDLFMYGHKMFNTGEFFSTTTQSGSAGVSGSFTFNNSGSANGVSLANNTQLTVANAGTYNIQFSAQIEANAGADSVYVWYKKNGTNIPSSATKVILPNNTAQVMTVNILDDANANDYYEIVYQTTNGLAVVLAEVASGNIPAIPSVIATLTQVR